MVAGATRYGRAGILVLVLAKEQWVKSSSHLSRLKVARKALKLTAGAEWHLQLHRDDGDGDEPRALPGDVSDASALVAGLGARVRAVLHDVTNLE